MATEEHKNLSAFIKNVHSVLRRAAANGNAESAWKEHCTNTEVLKKYAASMQKLATTYWEENSADSSKSANSRITWSANVCREYFHTDKYLVYRNKEIDIAQKINLQISRNEMSVCDKITLLDVGSCYNPFKIYDFLNVVAVDLCPANEEVSKCDFLNVTIGEKTNSCNNEIIQFERESFDALTFIFVLEYLPSSEQRIEACRRAHALLRTEGLLVIATPDSKHVGANSKTMKCWRYTLARLGFSRIKYEKFPHMHCMAFRKSLHEEIACRWASLHREPYMNLDLNIPQDFQSTNAESAVKTYQYDENSIIDGFEELPQFNLE